MFTNTFRRLNYITSVITIEIFLLKEVVCDINSKNCMSHVFKDYPELDVVKDFINCFNENNTDTNEEMTYIL